LIIFQGKADGFYASKWCNVFYRCFQTIKYEFLCAKRQGGDRLWWSQHSTDQSVSQQNAQCAFPCDTKRPCSSPGGILLDNGPTVTESTSDATRIQNACNATPANGAQNDDSRDDLFKLPDSYDACSGVADQSLVASQNYCNVFHACVNGKRKDFVCAKASKTYDLWWNDATKRCDWPCKVQCSKSLYGSQQTAADVQKTDNSVNAAICAAASSSSSYAPSQYPAAPSTAPQYYSSSAPVPTHPPVYPTQTSGNNNNYNNNNNFFTVPAGMYGK
jgi:hypothetical protein